MKKIKKQFNKLRSIEPSTQWQKNQWDVLLDSIAPEQKNSLTVFEKINCIVSHPAVFRPIGNIAIVILVVFMGSWGMIVSAENTAHGDLLYPLKQAMERVSLAVTVNDGARIQKQTARVSQRLFELNNLAIRLEYSEVSSKSLDKTVQDLHREITAVHNGLEQAKQSGNPEELLAVATHVEKETNNLVEQISKTAKGLPAGVSVSIDEIIKEAELLAEDTSNQVLEVIVSEDLGNNSVEEGDIIKRLEQRIAEVESVYAEYDVDAWKAEQDLEDGSVVEYVTKLDDLVLEVDAIFDTMPEKFVEKDYVGILSTVNHIESLLSELDATMYPQEVKGVEEVVDEPVEEAAQE